MTISLNTASLSILSREEIQKTFSHSDDKIVSVFLKTVTGLIIGSAAGAIFTALVAGGGGTIAAGAAIGGIFGWHLGLKQEIKNKRLQTVHLLLSQIEDPTLRASIQKIENVAARAFFNCPTEYYSLHHQIAEVTDEIQTKASSISQAWKRYLCALQGQPVRYSDGTNVVIDCSEHVKRCEGRQTPLTCSQVDATHPDYWKDLQQIEALEIECFGAENAHSASRLAQLFSSPQNSCLVVRDSSQSIVGFLHYRQEQRSDGETSLHITRVGRKADAAKQGIGESLFKMLYSQDLTQFSRVFLEVRQNNFAAQALYKKFGFQPDEIISNYYCYPTENAIVMNLDWDSYQLAAIA